MFNETILFRTSLFEQIVVLALSGLILLLMVWAHRPFRSFLSYLALTAKVLALGLLSFLLLQPERCEELPVKRDPTLLILQDETPSMETRDIEVGNTIMSRRQARDLFLASPEWQNFLEATEFKIEERSFGGEETNLTKALENATSDQPAVVLMLSDGAWNSGGSPAHKGQEYRVAGTPIYSLAFGADEKVPDTELRLLQAPLLVEAEEPFLLKVEVSSTYGEEVSSKLRLVLGEEVLEERALNLERRKKQVVEFRQELPSEGVFEYKIELVPQLEEIILENNSVEARVEVRTQRVKVLLVDTLPRWEYRFIRNAMMRDEKVDVSCLLLHPGIGAGEGPGYIEKFPESLASYDIIFLGDIGMAEGQLSEADAQKIVQAVKENATGLILMPGQKGWQQTLVDSTSFSALYPVDFSEPLGGEAPGYTNYLKLSSVGQSSLLMNLSVSEAGNEALWASLPGFDWYQPVARLKAGSRVLAYHSDQQNEEGLMPLLVTSSVGRGKVLYMGIDSSWKWRRGVEDLYHYRFWRQMARWMSYQRNLTDGNQARIFMSQESARVGQEVLVTLQVMSAEGKPAKAEEVKLLLTSPNERPRLIPMRETEQWGEFEGKVRYVEAGEHTLEVVVNGEAAAQRSLSVAAVPKEAMGEPADYDTLNELARLSKATSYRFENRADLLSDLARSATPDPQYNFWPLAHQWGWYLGVFCLLVVSWILRRIELGE